MDTIVSRCSQFIQDHQRGIRALFLHEQSGRPLQGDRKEQRMVPFVFLIALFVLLNAIGLVFGAYDWWDSLRLALAGMFLLTASAHWGKRRRDLIQMVPPAFPRPDLLVTGTGILEILGAVGLLIPSASHYAALALFLLLIAVFPANVHAARRRLTIAGRAVPALWPRTLLQIVFLATAAAIFMGASR
jgi:uncharacterized membrane protein